MHVVIQFVLEMRAITFARAMFLAVALGGSAAGVASAQRSVVTTLPIYYGAKRVGQETTKSQRTPAGFKQTTKTTVDWGPGISLETWLQTAPNGRPLGAGGSGKSWSWYDAPAEWHASPAAKSLFPISNPFPVSRQAELVRYWLNAGKPRSIDTSSGKRVEILKCGSQSVAQPKKPLRLSCFEISGLGWGNSLVWLDSGLQLKAAYVPTVLGQPEFLQPDARPARNDLVKVAAQGAERLARRVPPFASADKQLLVLRGVNVVDVVNGTEMPEATIMIQGDRISAIGPESAVTIPAGARILALHGKTVMPGLWEMHAHIKAAEWGPAYLGTGITTARDLGNDFEFIREFRHVANSNAALSPRMLLAGIIDATASSPFADYHAETPELGRKLVDKYHAAGFDQIKVWKNVPKDALPAIIARAHQYGMKVTGHIPDAVSLRAAIADGQDQINHIGALISALDSDQPDPFKSSDELVQFLARNNIVVDPTLNVAEFRLRRLDRPLSAIEPGALEVPTDLLKANQSLRGNPDNTAELDALLRKCLDLVKALHDRDVPIVAGSDGSIPGYSLIREVELYVEAGLSPMDAIRTATIVPARVMGKSDEVGAIAPGMRADILILDRDPLQDITALRSNCAVMKSGRLYDTRTLRAAAGFNVPTSQHAAACGG